MPYFTLVVVDGILCLSGDVVTPDPLDLADSPAPAKAKRGSGVEYQYCDTVAGQLHPTATIMHFPLRHLRCVSLRTLPSTISTTPGTAQHCHIANSFTTHRLPSLVLRQRHDAASTHIQERIICTLSACVRRPLRSESAVVGCLWVARARQEEAVSHPGRRRNSSSISLPYT